MRVKKNTSVLKGYGPPNNVETMKDYASDPFVVEKLEKAKAFLQQHPIPEKIIKK